MRGVVTRVRGVPFAGEALGAFSVGRFDFQEIHAREVDLRVGVSLVWRPPALSSGSV